MLSNLMPMFPFHVETDGDDENMKRAFGRLNLPPFSAQEAGLLSDTVKIMHSSSVLEPEEV